MSDQHPTPAAGGGARKGAPDGVNVTPGTGESGGGARPGKEGHGDGGEDRGATGHGGQSEIGYHGPGQLGDQDVPGADNGNAATKHG